MASSPTAAGAGLGTPIAPTAPPTSTPGIGGDEPLGYPLAPGTRTDLVVGETGVRGFAIGRGPTVAEATALQASSSDADLANASGWNCAVHFEYEGNPAVDWYVQPGTPVVATMDGTATLFINTHVNAFEYHGVEREPYIGNPDRARAPVSPFPGPGGGMGVYVSVINDVFRTDYGHLLLEETLADVPDAAFIGRYTRDYDYVAEFEEPLPFNVAEQVASWDVKRGDVIGYTGDAGYSEAPHLHYQITRRANGARLCPTGEVAFADNGWLLR